MSYRALALGATAGFLSALIPSCGEKSCGPQSCSGCCDASGGCVASPSASACGAQGGSCRACSAEEVCAAGECRLSSDAGSPQGCGPGKSEPCLKGCCTGFGAGGQCLDGKSVTNCGRGGQLCQACEVSAGQQCAGGQCVAPDAGGAGLVGKPCTDDDNCAGFPGLSCRKATASGLGLYSGGYCTKTCTQQPDCPEDALCLGFAAEDDEPESLCVSKCRPPGQLSPDCRSLGYVCYSLVDPNGKVEPDGACWIYPPPEGDGGLPADKTGQSCARDSDCRNPPNDGVCLEPTSGDGGPTGWPNGYCTSPCRSDWKCGDGGLCLPVGADTQYCFGRCSTPLQGQGDCRKGYVCEPLRFLDGGMAAESICLPDCNYPGAGCALGFRCKASGYCQ